METVRAVADELLDRARKKRLAPAVGRHEEFLPLRALLLARRPTSLLLVGGLFTLRPDWTRASRAMAWLGGLAPVCLICGLSVHVRRVPLAHPLGAYVSADLPEEIDFENALVLFTGPYPSTFLAPQLPPSAKTAFLFPAAWTDEAIAGLYPLARERIDLAEGPVIAVINTRSDSGLLIGGLHDHYGLAVDETDCRPIPNNMESLDVDWIACPAAKGGA